MVNCLFPKFSGILLIFGNFRLARVDLQVIFLAGTKQTSRKSTSGSPEANNEGMNEAEMQIEQQPPKELKKSIWNCLASLNNSLNFAVSGRAFELPSQPGLEIEAFGSFLFPLIKRLLKLVSFPFTNNPVLFPGSTQAPRGARIKTVARRDLASWQIDPDKVTHPKWNSGLQKLIQRIADAVFSSQEQKTEKEQPNSEKGKLYWR